MSDPRPLIEARDLVAGYGQERVLDHVDLTIHEGDFLAVVGPNGGGKTTLVKVLLGLMQPWSGAVIHHHDLPPGKIGYVPQFSTFEHQFPLRVSHVVRMGRLGSRGLWRRYDAEDDAQVQRTLERLRLTNLAGTHIGELSGGQLQRVLIARALVSDPAILFLDEPTSSVDSESRRVLNDLLEGLSGRITVVVITHDVTGFSRLVKQYACINRKVIYSPTPQMTSDMMTHAYGCGVALPGAHTADHP